MLPVGGAAAGVGGARGHLHCAPPPPGSSPSLGKNSFWGPFPPPCSSPHFCETVLGTEWRANWTQNVYLRWSVCFLSPKRKDLSTRLWKQTDLALNSRNFL